MSQLKTIYLKIHKQQTLNPMNQNERIVFVDYIRVIACFLVMLVHASENFYGADPSGLAGDKSMLLSEANRFWVAFFDGGVARTCVPLFMVVSAFLLVPVKPGVTMGEFYKRRFKRILPPMVTFLLLYTFLPLAWGAMTWEQSIADLKLIPFNFPSMAGHLWFMYPLISLYLIIPVVSPWLERASAKDELLFIALFVFASTIPWLHRFVYPEVFGECFWNPSFNALYYCSGYLGYLVLAHYIRVHINWATKKRLIVGATCFAIGAIFTGWAFWYKGVPMQPIETPMLEWGWEFCMPNLILATFGAFLMFTCIRQEKAPKIITAISRYSFGMYLMHMFFLAPIAAYFVQGNPAEPIIPVCIAIPCIAILTYICTVVTSKIISLIPGSKWLIGC